MKTIDVFLIRLFDILVSLILLPFFLLCFLLMIIPQLIVFKKIFYRSKRVGKNGKIFTYIKIKTMYDAEQELGRAHLERERIPSWGRFLRKFHLDEMTELFFIMIGTESFVGPRPLLPEHTVLVDSEERRMLKPGWTGLSQIFLKRKGILPSRIQRRLDMHMRKQLNAYYYIVIILATMKSYIMKSQSKNKDPGPTVLAYRQNVIMKNNSADNET
jgi:lipopolysaccharide/colanic/teichoic acid biosynthesis glycosyltransferase